MTTQGKSLEELGRRAVGCKHWRWMPGMLHGIEAMDEMRYVSRFSEFSIYADDDGRIPILSDPATLGCLLHLVREAHEDADIVAFVVHSHGSPEKWCVDVGPAPDFHDERKYVYRPTEAEALVAALEAAP